MVRLLSVQGHPRHRTNACDTALSFDPERFIDERVQKYLVPNPFIFLPFNAGPRICLGQQVCPSCFTSSS